MKEKEFGQYILKRVKEDSHMRKWYEKHIAGRGFENTVEKIAFGLCQHDGISVEEAIILSLFIGLSTEMIVMTAKELIGESGVIIGEKGP